MHLNGGGGGGGSEKLFLESGLTGRGLPQGRKMGKVKNVKFHFFPLLTLLYILHNTHLMCIDLVCQFATYNA